MLTPPQCSNLQYQCMAASPVGSLIVFFDTGGKVDCVFDCAVNNQLVQQCHHIATLSWSISQLQDDLFYVDAFAAGKADLFKGALLAASNNGATNNLCNADRSSDYCVCHDAVSSDSYHKEPKHKT